LTTDTFAAREEKFSNAQISAFITIIHTLLDNIKSNHFQLRILHYLYIYYNFNSIDFSLSLGKQISLKDNVLAYKELVAGVGIPPSIDVPNPLKCFTMKVGMATLEYLKTSLFQHHELFQYLYTEDQDEIIITQKVCISSLFSILHNIIGLCV